MLPMWYVLQVQTVCRCRPYAGADRMQVQTVETPQTREHAWERSTSALNRTETRLHEQMTGLL